MSKFRLTIEFQELRKEVVENFSRVGFEVLSILKR